MRHPSAATSLFVLASCAPSSFAPEEQVEKDRPLASRVSVLGDDTRSTPAPGERASFQLLVVSPGPQVSWTALLTLCRSGRSADNIAACEPGSPLLAQTAPDALSMPPDTLPALTFQVPDAAQLAPHEDALLVQGYLCPQSALDPALLAALASGDLARALTFANPCADKAQNGLILSSPIALERDSTDRNHTPLIKSVTWSLAEMKAPIANGTAWTSVATASTKVNGCRGQGFSEITLQKEPIAIQLELEPGAREAYLKPSLVPGRKPQPRNEIPQVLGFASAGEFDIARDNQQSEGQILQLLWKPPQPQGADADSLLVRFWFLLTDDRDDEAQATSWTERALCLVR